MSALPRRLSKEPIIEAIWQARFDDTQGISDILPGVLFSELRKNRAALQQRRLPLADIPDAIARMDPNLRYTPKVLLEEPEGSFAWQVGDRVITLNCRRPYVGWARFRDAVIELSEIVEASGLVSSPPQHSLRYIDLLQDTWSHGLSMLRVSLNVGKHVVRNHVQLRVEIPDEGCRHVVQVATEARLTLVGAPVVGMIVDLETSPATPAADWSALRAQLDGLHDRSKTLFFRQILTEESISQLGPEYA